MNQIDKIKKEYEKRFRDNEEYFDIWDGNVDFRKGYRGYDGFLVDVWNFFESKLSSERENGVREFVISIGSPSDLVKMSEQFNSQPTERKE